MFKIGKNLTEFQIRVNYSGTILTHNCQWLRLFFAPLSTSHNT